MDGASLAAIIVAFIAAVATVGGSLINAKIGRESRDFLRGNGRGTVTNMVEDIHKGLGEVKWNQEESKLQLRALLTWQVNHDQLHEREVESK